MIGEYKCYEKVMITLLLNIIRIVPICIYYIFHCLYAKQDKYSNFQ